MPVKTQEQYDIKKITVTSPSNKSEMAVSLVPAEGYDGSRLSVQVSQSQTNLREVLGVQGVDTPHRASSSLMQYEVPAADNAKVLEKLGLPKDLGGKSGVKITFSQHAGDKQAGITIEMKDPKAPGFTEAHGGDVIRKLASTKNVLPDVLKAEIVKANPAMAAHIELESADRGGTRMKFSPVENGNLPFSIRHNAKTGMDEIQLPVSDDPQKMKAMHERVTEHLKAKGIIPTGSNIDRATEVAAANKGDPGRTQVVVGSLQIALPKGSGEKALAALSQEAEYKVGNVSHHSKPIVAPEIAKAAIPEMEATVRKVAIAEHEAHVASTKPGGKPTSFGNLLTKLGVGAIAAVGAGVASAAQAPEGHRIETGAKAAGKALAENVLPGVTETDTCKKVGAAAGYVGGAAGALAGVAAATGGTIISAPVTGGGSVAASPYTVPAAGLLGGSIGQRAGEMLGEGVCKLARAATTMITESNKSHIAYKPTGQTVASTKVPDTARGTQAVMAPNHSEGRS